MKISQVANEYPSHAGIPQSGLQDDLMLSPESQLSDDIQHIVQESVGLEIGERLGDSERYSDFFAALAQAYLRLKSREGFVQSLDDELENSLQRPTPLIQAAKLTQHIGGAKIFLKREDCSSSLSQLQIAVTGQAMLAKRLGRHTLVSFSRNGFCGQVTASIAKRMGLSSIIFVDRTAMEQQPGNILRIQQLGSHVEVLDARNVPREDLRVVALEYCLCNPRSFLVMGLEGAPEPYPEIAMDSASIIGREVLQQVTTSIGKLPDLMVASVADEADAFGFFVPVLETQSIGLAQVQTWGIGGVTARDDDEFFQRYLAQQAASRKPTGDLRTGGIRHPSLRRENALLKSSGRVEYPAVRSVKLRKVIRDMVALERLAPALTTAQSLSYAVQKAAQMRPDQSVVVLVADHMKRECASPRRH